MDTKKSKANAEMSNGKNRKNPPKTSTDIATDVSLQPPDGGWGWMILLATCVNMFVIPPVYGSYGVLVPALIQQFDADIASVSWVPAIAGVTWNLAAPWASAMLTLYSHRRMAVIGTCLCSVAMILSSFVPNMILLNITYGAMMGFGTGISNGMGVLIIQEYFRDKRALVNGITMAGGSIGQMAVPILFQLLLFEYGLRGTLLIYSGFVLQTLVVSFLLQPSRWHYQLVEQPQQQNDPPKEPEKITEMETKQRPISWVGHHSEHESLLHKLGHKSVLLAEVDKMNGVNHSGRNLHVEQTIQEDEEMDIRELSHKTSNSPTPQPSTPSSIKHPFVSHHGNTRNRSYSLNIDRGQKAGEPNEENPLSLAAFNYIGSVGSIMGSIASLASIPIAVPVHVQRTQLQSNKPLTIQEMRQQLKKHTQVDPRPKWLCWLPRCPQMSSIFQFALLKNVPYTVITVATAIGRLVYQQFNVFVPPFAQQLGVPPTSAASLVTILAAADTVARLVVPILSERLSRRIPKIHIYGMGFIFNAAGCLGIAFSTNYASLVVSCIIFGIGFGGITGLSVIILVDYVGLQMLAAAFGLSVFVCCFIILPGIPVFVFPT